MKTVILRNIIRILEEDTTANDITEAAAMAARKDEVIDGVGDQPGLFKRSQGFCDRNGNKMDRATFVGHLDDNFWERNSAYFYSLQTLLGERDSNSVGWLSSSRKIKSTDTDSAESPDVPFIELSLSDKKPHQKSLNYEGVATLSVITKNDPDYESINIMRRVLAVLALNVYPTSTVDFFESPVIISSLIAKIKLGPAQFTSGGLDGKLSIDIDISLQMLG